MASSPIPGFALIIHRLCAVKNLSYRSVLLSTQMTAPTDSVAVFSINFNHNKYKEYVYA